MLMDKIKKKLILKTNPKKDKKKELKKIGFKTKEITIKKISIKIDIKIIQNQILRDENVNKIQLQKGLKKQTAIKSNEDQI
jgi:hypothetical protein